MENPLSLILGPQSHVDQSWFSQVQVSTGKRLGESCPVVPPTDPSALNSFVVNLQYYDLPLSLYIVHNRTGDPAFQTLARKCADSWWQHPTWIQSGAKLNFENGEPAPRHAGIGGLILRALDGRPEMWAWITAYTRYQFDIWLGMRIDNPALHYGVREGAFMLQYAAWLAAAHPDSEVRAEFLFKAESLAVNYYGRLQKEDGSWRWDDFDVKDPDGGTLVGITQPFQVGLLLMALIDVHRLTTNVAVKESIKNQILKGCRHLYEGGPYRKDEPIPYDPSLRRRDFFYLYHGGTSVNPSKFEKGGWSYPGNNVTEIKEGRQAIGPVVAAFGYAYSISGDEFYKLAGDELWDSAYGETDGIHNFMDTDGKGWNQNVRRAGSYPAWRGGVVIPPPVEPPIDPPKPPEPPPIDPPVDSIPVVAVLSPVEGASISGIITVTITVTDVAGITEVYLLVDGVMMISNATAPYKLELDTTKLTEGNHSLLVRAWNKLGKAGDARLTVNVANTTKPPEPPLPPIEPPSQPTTPVVRKVSWPTTETKQNAVLEAQWKERYRMKRHLTGAYVEFEKVDQ